MPIIYILTNPAFEDYVKIGQTNNLEQRLRQLDNTSVPLPFRCVYAVEVDGNQVNVEQRLHQVFADHRTRKGREFFEINPQRAIAALQLTNGRNVTPKDDVAEDDEGVEALSRATRTRRTNIVHQGRVPIGEHLHFAGDENVTAKVVNERRIDFEGEVTSLSQSALILMRRDGFTWQSVNGWTYWTYQGETLAERADRFDREEEDREEGQARLASILDVPARTASDMEARVVAP